MSSKNSDHYFLKGGGEMGALIRAKDWSKTALGDPAHWPQSLRTMVAVMLDNPFGMYIAWGSDYIQLYNDGYRPILGATKHPQALGISTRETFSEIWDNIIGSMFDDVMKGKAVGFPDLMLPLNRNGYVEECYFDFAYSPIRKDNGEVGGVLVTVIETTNKKNIEEALKESEARFRAIADDAPVFIFLAGENAEVEYLNKTWREYTGVSTDDYKGRAWAEITHIDDIEPATKIYMDGFNKRESCSFENRQKGIDGIYRTILWKATPRFSPNGEFIGMMGVGLDIHERKKSEEKLRDSEQRLRLANEASGVAVWEWDVIGGQIKWDNEMFKIYGVTPTADNLVDYTTWSTAVVPEELAQQENILQNTVKNKGQSSRSFNIKRANDGELRHIEAIETVRTNAAGEAEWVVGTNLDVTEKMLARRKVEDSEQLFRLAIAGSNQIVFSQDKNLIHTWIYNPHPDFTQNDIIGKSDQDLHTPESAAVLTNIKEKVLETGIAFHGDIEIEVSSQKLFYTMHIEAILDIDGRVNGIIGTAIDITERIKTQRQIKETESLLRKKTDQLELSITSGKIGLWHWDVKNDILYWSNEQKAIYGLEPSEELLNVAKYRALVIPEDWERLNKDLQSAPMAKEQEYEFRIIRKNDGAIRWIKSRARNILDEEGALQFVSGVNIDVTEQVLNLNKIQESEERFRTLADQAPMWVWLTDTKVNILYANNALLNFVGIESSVEFTGKVWESIVHPEDIELVYQKYNDGVLRQASFNFECRIMNAVNKTYEWIFLNIVARYEVNEFAGFIGTAVNINDQKVQTEKLKESEGKLRSLIDAAPIGIGLFIGRDLIIENPNQEFIDIVGKGANIAGKRLTDVMPELIEHGQPYLKILDDVFTSGKMYQSLGDPVNIIRNGVMHYGFYNIYYVPLFDLAGNVYGIMDIATDVTEQVMNRKKVEESEERFRFLAQSLPQLVWMTDGDGQFEFGSSRWFDYTGVEPGSKGEWEKIIHPEDIHKINAEFNTCLKTGKTYSFDVRIKSKEGNYRWHTVIGEPVKNSENKIVKWVGAFTDIHEQKEASEKIEQSEKQFSTLANNIQNLAWIADGEGYIYWYNQRWYDYTGTTLEEMEGWGWEKVHHPNHINRVVDFVKTAWQNNQPFELTFPLRSANGEYRWFLTLAYPVTDKEGKIINWIGTNTDITDQKSFAEQLEEQVEERTAELVKMNKELESFAYISSHDLQEPLRKIQTFASRIKENEENNLSDTGKDMFNRMQDAAKRMQTLIQDLLAYSRTTTTDHSFETTDLNDIIAEVKEDLLEELNDKNATIEANQLCAADIIPFQFRQLMHNLISNSLKFSNPDDPPHIQIRSEIANGLKFKNEHLLPQKKYCHIAVSDNGIGFEQQYSEKIFKVFQRLHGKNEYNGTGIGLSIVQKIVENHHGIITANGEPNKGATFDIYIPAR